MTFAPIQDIGQALLSLLSEVLLFLPRLLTFAVILLVGYIVARIVRDLLTKLLHVVHFDAIADRAGVSRALERAGTRMDAARVLALVVFWWIFLVFIEMAVNSLGLVAVTAFINSVLAYIPNVFVAILILIVGALLANVVAGAVRGAAAEAGLTTSGLLASVARWAVLVFVFLAALTQLNVAQNMIFILFAAMVGMLALAGGLALGLGGVDTARSLLSGWSMGRMLQPGQRVQIRGQAGTVVRHDLSSTVVDTPTGRVSIPNSMLSQEELTILGQGGTPTPTPPREPAGTGA
ncbi:MAG TPA: mechanosensitive ion channel domain-containing protein [Ktedonobacterales bacterium]|nr:mechanosensitive ion channel domain-containing protein [Ktedonobacterales bacterium]